MSVLIKGLKMPKEDALKVAIRDGIASVYLDEGKADYYSVIELPDHGDLIEKDYLVKRCDAPHWYVWLNEIEDAPAVIPAERSKE